MNSKRNIKRVTIELFAGFVAFFLALLFVRWLRVPDETVFTVIGLSFDRASIAFVIIALAFERAVKLPTDLFLIYRGNSPSPH